MAKRVVKKWSGEEIERLRENFNKSYEVLEEMFSGRTKRALKHKINGLGLERSEKKRWSEEEVQILKEYPGLMPKEFVEKEMVDRSAYQIAKKLREIRGTANRVLKEGWDAPSEELAYILGSWCSDGTCSEYVASWSQKQEDEEFLEKVQLCCESIFGLPVKVKDGEYMRVYICSREMKRKVFSLDGKNVCKPEWGELIEKRYKWIVDDDKYFWQFIGGLYDGDGCLAVQFRNSTKSGLWKKVSIGIGPVRSRNFILREMKKRGFEWMETGPKGKIESIELKGGKEKVEEFVERVRSVLYRKRERIGNGFEKVSRKVANMFLEEYHYLGASLRPGTVSFAGKKNGSVEGVVCFGSPQSAYENQRLLGEKHAGKVRELVRLCTVDDAGKNFTSALLAQGLRRIGEEGVWVVLSYADPAVGHKGTIYKATNAYYLGETKSGKKKFAYITAKGREKQRAKELFMVNNRDRLKKK